MHKGFAMAMQTNVPTRAVCTFKDTEFIWKEPFQQCTLHNRQGQTLWSNHHNIIKECISTQEGLAPIPEFGDDTGNCGKITVAHEHVKLESTTSVILSNRLQWKLQEDTVLVSLLKTCMKEKDVCRGSKIHADIIKRGLFEKDVHLGNALVSLYAKCGALSRAQEVFKQLPIKNVVSWNALISGYVQHGHSREAFLCFERMQDQGILPNAVTYVCILKACGSVEAASLGNELHDAIIREGLLEKNVLVGNALVDMYAKCAAPAKAHEVFNQLPHRNVVSWNALITGYIQCGHGDKALSCYEQMQHESISPDKVTIICILKACGTVGVLRKGKEINASIVGECLVEKEILVGTTLVDMYAKCGALEKAQDIFNHLQVRNVVSWSALIAGYAQFSQGEEALNCYRWMQREGYSPNAVTYVSLLKACGSVRAVNKGVEVHAEILREGLLEKNVLVGNALVDMYMKCRRPSRAQDVFDSLPLHNVVSWTALISGYVEYGHSDAAINCFEHMHYEGFLPNAVTFVCILKACGSIGRAEKGKEIHTMLDRNGLLKVNLFLGNALVDMYAKCGIPAKAHQVFDELPARDVVSWNALMNAYAQLGNDDAIIFLFNKMIAKDVEPDAVTFTLMLNAYSHSGLLDKGLMCFECMNSRFGIVPTSEHRTCMIDLFGRAGYVDKVIAMINMMPAYDIPLIWTVLLSACQKRGNVNVGRSAFEHAVQVNENLAAAYICMSNMYVTCPTW